MPVGQERSPFNQFRKSTVFNIAKALEPTEVEVEIDEMIEKVSFQTALEQLSRGSDKTKQNWTGAGLIAPVFLLIF